MKIDTTLFELDVIYNGLNQPSIWKMVIELKYIRTQLIETKEKLVGEIIYSGKELKEILSIDQQLYFLNCNIKTLETALMCYETKILEKRPSLGDLQVFCLN